MLPVAVACAQRAGCDGNEMEPVTVPRSGSTRTLKSQRRVNRYFAGAHPRAYKAFTLRVHDARNQRLSFSIMLARLKITARINVTLFLAVLGTLIVGSIGYSMLRAQMMDERQNQLRNLLDMAVAVARNTMTAAGGPATEAGRKAFFSALQSSRFGDEKQTNYIFGLDYNGIATCMKDRSQIGQNLFERVDARGFKFIQAFINTAKGPSGADFVQYMYEKGIGGRGLSR